MPNRLLACFFTLLSSLTLCNSSFAEDDESLLAGKKSYEAKCAKCHGKLGEGVADVYDENLYGDRPFAELVQIITDTMPDEHPEECVGEEARQVADYMYETFYTAAARAKHRPARVELSRLTRPQYLNSVADIAAHFIGSNSVNEKRGLKAEYYNDRRAKKEKREIERIDPEVKFDFGEKSPSDKIGEEEFFISWNGGLIAEETGVYEIAIRTENGFELFLNGGRTPLIDGSVVSGEEVTDHTATVTLLGGRAYPIRIEYFKSKRKGDKKKSASVELRWKPPHKEWETIPERSLSPEWFPKVLVVNTVFPPDDSSLGYARGSSVSRSWDDATTYAALEVVDGITSNLREITRRQAGNSDTEKYQSFCLEFAELAFRRPLTEEQKQFYVQQRFENTDPQEALKQSVLLILKSPHFLYLGLDDGPIDSYDVAERLAYALWDSIPDKTLRNEAAANRLQTREQILAQAERMVHDPRTRLKVGGFFDHLLQLDEADDVDKDDTEFPGFDEHLLADLRTSLLLFVNDVVWSEQSDFRELLLSNDLYLNKRLADFYDVELKNDRGFERVSFEKSERSGVVTHPFLLSALAYHKSTSPIHRGVFVTRRILGRALKPPPMAIEFMDNKFDPHLTMREKVSELTKSKTCMTCHSVINPLGFSLEHYDAVGRFRTEEKEKPINAEGVYASPDSGLVKLTGARDLAEYAVHSEVAQRNFVEQLFHHLVKQPAAAYGPSTLDELRNAFAANQFHIQKLAIDIAVTAASHDLDQMK